MIDRVTYCYTIADLETVIGRALTVAERAIVGIPETVAGDGYAVAWQSGDGAWTYES